MMLIIDNDLGEIELVKNLRARRITVRFKNGRFYLTHPAFATKSLIEEAISEMKPQLLKLKEKVPDTFVFTPSSPFKTISFTLELKECNCSNYYIQLKDGILGMSFPEGTDFGKAEIQSIIRTNIEKVLRHEAKRIFPQKVKLFADLHGLNFTDVKINKSRTRWGSCSSRKAINLSYSCMLLPEYLIDFVILHELCHTIEMNHGPNFWALLDKLTGGRAKELTQDLKMTRISW